MHRLTVASVALSGLALGAVDDCISLSDALLRQQQQLRQTIAPMLFRKQLRCTKHTCRKNSRALDLLSPPYPRKAVGRKIET